MEFDQKTFMSSVENITKAKESFENIIESMNNSIQLISNNWDSSASNMYTSKLRKQRTNFETYITELDNCIEYLNKKNEEAENMEKTNKNLIED
ncbi:MAG: hypothetical protein J6O62_00050 [Bacilli bacterium]|nr:hypothetical protein [Bacilli bacterium]